MRIHLIHLLGRKPDTPERNQGIDFEPYFKEHDRLEAIISDSESIWEARTFQIAAGGLSLTFAAFSFLAGKGFRFDWQIALIWGLFVFCIVLNYVSHRISIKNARKMQAYLADRRKKSLIYDESSTEIIYQMQDIVVNVINIIVEFFLIADVIYTIVYFSIHLLK